MDKKFWALLCEYQGTYIGKGINHEGEPFTDRLIIQESLPGKLVSLSCTATGAAEEIYHHEISWLGWDLAGVFTLFVNSNNHPTVTPHNFRRIEEAEGVKRLIFGFGDMENRESFREEIALELYVDGDLGHQYSWGMPGGDFAARSGSKMQRVNL